MFQEIKYYLFKIFLTQKKKLALFACLVFVGLFVVSQTTHAFVLDLASVQLDALDFIDNSILKYFVFLALLAAESIVLLFTSANLLDWSSSLPVTLGDNPLVNAGWHFTNGLVNLSFVLIFIVIALSYILKVDTFGMKKALPRLIIIALLTNFSLLFVKMFTDMGWIFQNSFASVFFENGSLATAAIESLKTNSLQLMGTVMAIPALYLTVSLIPYANVAALFGIGLALLTGAGQSLFLGTISQTIMAIIFNFVISLVFLVFSALFLVRIAVIWLLAIFAPLALMAYIMPSTQKYFSQWLKALVQWVFLGVVVFFLMGLGIKLFGLLDLGGKEIILSDRFSGWKFFDAFYKYIFLIIYLIVVLGACKKLVPAGVGAVWSLAEKGIKKGAGPAAVKAAKAGIFTGGKAAPQLAKYGERMKAWGEKPTKGLLGVGRYAARRWGTAMADAGRGAKAQREEQLKQDILAQAEKMKKDLRPDQILARFKKALGPQAKAVSLWALFQKDSKKYKEYLDAKQFTEDDEVATGKLLWDGGQKEFASLRASKKMLEAVDPVGAKVSATASERQKTLAAEEEKLRATPMPLSFSEQQRIDAKIADLQLRQKEAEELEKEPMKKLIGAIKPSQVLQISASSFEDPLFRKTILDVFGGNHMAEIARNFGRGAVNEIQREIDKMDIGNLAKKNPGLALWLAGGQANNLGFHLPTGSLDLDPKELKRVVKEARVALEKNRTSQRDLIKRDYQGDREPVMFRDYYRPDINEERKSLIKEIVSELGQKLPTKEEINRNIGKLETNYQKLSGEFADSLKNLKEAQEKYQKTLAQGIVGPQLNEMKKVVDSVEENHRIIRQKTGESMDKIEKMEAEKLKVLWKK